MNNEREEREINRLQILLSHFTTYTILW